MENQNHQTNVSETSSSNSFITPIHQKDRNRNEYGFKFQPHSSKQHRSASFLIGHDREHHRFYSAWETEHDVTHRRMMNENINPFRNQQIGESLGKIERYDNQEMGIFHYHPEDKTIKHQNDPYLKMIHREEIGVADWAMIGAAMLALAFHGQRR
eukprot:gb/GECH01005848.1/.p1 GENE.gb/GECH01005848.1/~~gb/GECH01005848.1/.p1  ORF type:complete len:155 (+),score=38.40 gb/GECH01005848.1/:1-465(+)